MESSEQNGTSISETIYKDVRCRLAGVWSPCWAQGLSIIIIIIIIIIIALCFTVLQILIFVQTAVSTVVGHATSCLKVLFTFGIHE